jgi:hypothetical protein
VQFQYNLLTGCCHVMESFRICGGEHQPYYRRRKTVGFYRMKFWMSPYAVAVPGIVKPVVLSRLHDFSDCCTSNKVKMK